MIAIRVWTFSNSMTFAWWSRMAWVKRIPFVSDVCRFPTCVILTSQNVVAHSSISWTPPGENIIKINVDGFFLSFGVSGIEGVFKDHLGAVLLHFVKQANADSTIYTEILATREGLLIAGASKWFDSIAFEVESNSTNVVSWYLNSSSVSWPEISKYYQKDVVLLCSKYRLVHCPY